MGADSQAALVRTRGNGFAHLAQWQTGPLAAVAADSAVADDELASLATVVTEQWPRLQTYA